MSTIGLKLHKNLGATDVKLGLTLSKAPQESGPKAKMNRAKTRSKMKMNRAKTRSKMKMNRAKTRSNRAKTRSKM